MTGTDRVLVVGSYPPIPVSGASATVAEVRKVWDSGSEVTVVAPRLCASHLTVPVFGLLAGRRLDNVRRVTGTDRLVMVMEEGYPLPAGPALYQLATVGVLVRALGAFRHVRLVQAGPLRLPPWVTQRLKDAADEFEVVAAGPSMAGVTPLGPAETRPSERARHIAGRLADRVLGSRAPAARGMAGRARRAARAALRGG